MAFSSFRDEAGTSDDITSTKCIKCVEALPCFCADQIEVGDHLIFNRAHYDHHAVVVGKKPNSIFVIIEVTSTSSGFLSGFLSFSGKITEIRRNEKQLDFESEKICVVSYKKRIYPKAKVADRANTFYEVYLKLKEFQYHLLRKNCEHFATFCVTGKAYSNQVAKLHLTIQLYWKLGLRGIDNEMTRNDKFREQKIICENCYRKNKKLFSVRESKITRSTGIVGGDIIRYKYWQLWHDAVVLEVKQSSKMFILCKIAHYAFCYTFYRTIKQEDLQITLNGDYKKLEYEPPEFEVYPPTTVVERAYKRIGEQQFVMYVNDSYHYTRWCKLRNSYLEAECNFLDDDSLKCDSSLKIHIQTALKLLSSKILEDKELCLLTSREHPTETQMLASYLVEKDDFFFQMDKEKYTALKVLSSFMLEKSSFELEDKQRTTLKSLHLI